MKADSGIELALFLQVGLLKERASIRNQGKTRPAGSYIRETEDKRMVGELEGWGRVWL